MSDWAEQTADDGPPAGRHYKRTDGAGLVFEVVGPVGSFRQPHVRVRRVDEPTDVRVFARSALTDPSLFREVNPEAAAQRTAHGQLRLKPS